MTLGKYNTMKAIDDFMTVCDYRRDELSEDGKKEFDMLKKSLSSHEGDKGRAYIEFALDWIVEMKALFTKEKMDDICNCTDSLYAACVMNQLLEFCCIPYSSIFFGS